MGAGAAAEAGGTAAAGPGGGGAGGPAGVVVCGSATVLGSVTGGSQRGVGAVRPAQCGAASSTTTFTLDASKAVRRSCTGTGSPGRSFLSQKYRVRGNHAEALHDSSPGETLTDAIDAG